LSQLLHGKPVLQHVYERLAPLNDIARIIIATDDNRIKDLAKGFGADVVMTSPDHLSGTDRCAEVAIDLEEDIIINVQGDEPFIEVRPIKNLIYLFSQDRRVDIATLACKLDDESKIEDRNTVKLVMSTSNRALYFSRSAIPSKIPSTHFKHIGVYAFRRKVLIELSKLSPSKLEMAESLEQLRWLENDYNIYAVMTAMDGLSIDTIEDLRQAELIMQNRY